MTDQYDDNCMSKKEIYERLERCKGGMTSVADDARFDRPSTVTYFKIKAQIDQCIRDN
jgi:hypothetical protein